MECEHEYEKLSFRDTNLPPFQGKPQHSCVVSCACGKEWEIERKVYETLRKHVENKDGDKVMIVLGNNVSGFAKVE